jgi:CBS domain containing-hemolysin-like protein
MIHRTDLGLIGDVPGDARIGDVMTPQDAPVLYPDVTLETALRVFRSRIALPVVRRHARGEVIGLLTLEDVARAFRIERRVGSPQEGVFWPSSHARTDTTGRQGH